MNFMCIQKTMLLIIFLTNYGIGCHKHITNIRDQTSRILSSRTLTISNAIFANILVNSALNRGSEVFASDESPKQSGEVPLLNSFPTSFLFSKATSMDDVVIYHPGIFVRDVFYPSWLVHETFLKRLSLVYYQMIN